MITTRLANSGDVSIWRDLRCDGIERYPAAFRMTMADHHAIAPEADAERLSHDDRLLCFDDQTAVGMIGYYQHTHAGAGHRAEIFGLYVVPAAQGGSGAKALVDALIVHARRAGVWQVELTVNEDNARAIAFYRRMGFIEIGRIPNAIIGQHGPEHDLLLCKDIGRRGLTS